MKHALACDSADMTLNDPQINSTISLPIQGIADNKLVILLININNKYNKIN